MTKLNKQELQDKIHACWVGKNIGGTMGTPYEGKREQLDITGYASAKGEPLPNDDLDLQLIWLCAMEEVGPYQLSARELGEYWVSYISPHWNEYGIGKSNLKRGLLPPFSGDYQNKKWRNSNGAWIRSEIWACLAPGYPDIARKYAWMDASVDHGTGEGSWAEQFTVTMESLAFVQNEIRPIIEQSLAAIPQDCRVARSVRLVLAAFDRGEDWMKTRELLLEDSRDLGWFQAPANVGFAVLGLLYGGGDFKRSMILAINCGDDTDCTGGTVGAFLGLLYGSRGIPEDWSSYIGDEIKTMCVDLSYRRVRKYKSCAALTDEVLKLVPTVLEANGVHAEFGEGASVFEEKKEEPLRIPKARYYYDAFESSALLVQVLMDQEPCFAPGVSMEIRVLIMNKMKDPHYADLKLHLPEGVHASDYTSTLYLDHQKPEGTVWKVRLTAETQLPPISRVCLEISLVGRPTLAIIPIYLLG